MDTTHKLTSDVYAVQLFSQMRGLYDTYKDSISTNSKLMNVFIHDAGVFYQLRELLKPEFCTPLYGMVLQDAKYKCLDSYYTLYLHGVIDLDCKLSEALHYMIHYGKKSTISYCEDIATMIKDASMSQVLAKLNKYLFCAACNSKDASAVRYPLYQIAILVSSIIQSRCYPLEELHDAAGDIFSELRESIGALED